MIFNFVYFLYWIISVVIGLITILYVNIIINRNERVRIYILIFRGKNIKGYLMNWMKSYVNEKGKKQIKLLNYLLIILYLFILLFLSIQLIP